MKKGIIGISIVVGSFLMILLLHKLTGGDAAQAGRSDWFPLSYIIPVMAGLLFFFMYKEGQK